MAGAAVVWQSSSAPTRRAKKGEDGAAQRESGGDGTGLTSTVCIGDDYNYAVPGDVRSTQYGAYTP